MSDRNTKVRASQIKDADLKPEDLNAINSPSDGQSPTYDLATGRFSWESPAGSGDMAKSTYDADNDNIVDKAESVDDGAGNSKSAADIKGHIDSTSNPHSVTKTQVGLGNVTNDVQAKADFTGYTEKTVPVGDDLVLINDSESTNALKRVKRSSLVAAGLMEIDIDGNLMPTTTSYSDNNFDLDVNDDIQPKV